MIKLQLVETADHLAKAKTLFHEYADTRRNDPALLNFPEEIKNLHRECAQPEGGVILAGFDGKLSGCVAVHKLDKT